LIQGFLGLVSRTVVRAAPIGFRPPCIYRCFTQKRPAGLQAVHAGQRIEPVNEESAMKAIASLTTVLLVGLLAAGNAVASSDVTNPELPRNLPQQGPVDVKWTDPAQFSEIRFSGNRREARRGDWVNDIAEYLRQRATKRLPQGDRLEVTITDIRRAGNYEPWRGIQSDTIRYMRDVYPPRIDLDFKLVGADGTVRAQGSRKLSDMSYLTGSTRVGDQDPLRYEKQLLDDWLRKEFKAPEA
jgi:hypothetical protein